MSSKDNWPGFCRAYANEFNITYAAAISQAGPAWKVYKTEKGLKFKYESPTPHDSNKDYTKGERVKKLKASRPTPRPVNSPYLSTGKDHLLNERMKLQHRKQGKRARPITAEETAPPEEDILVGTKGKNMKKTPTPSNLSIKTPPAKKRKRTPKKAKNAVDYSVYSGQPTPNYYPYPYPPPPNPYTQWGPTPPPPPGWGASPPPPPPPPPEVGK